MSFLDSIYGTIQFPKWATDWFWKLGRPWTWIGTWIGHGLVTALCVVVLWFLFGRIDAGILGAWIGYGIGVTFYGIKEWRELRTNPTAVWFDRLGDILGPIVLGGAFVWLLS